MVSGLVLAAGLSRRMRQPKQLLRLGQTTLLEHTISVAASSRLDEVVVVVSPDLAHRLSWDTSPCVRTVVNPRPHDGQSSSLRLGLACVAPESDGVLVLMCDQPGVTARLVNHLLEAWSAHTAGAIVPTYGGERGTPVLLGSELWPLVAQLTGDMGARAVLGAHPEVVRSIEVGHLGTPEDIDTPEEYARVVGRAP